MSITAHAKAVCYGLALALIVACGCCKAPTPAATSDAAWPKPATRGTGEGKAADRVLRGKVTAVDTTGGTVVVTIGHRQGLKPNTALMVHRDGRYVGTVIADAPFDNLSSARYGRDMRTDPCAGDDVTTKIFGPN